MFDISEDEKDLTQGAKIKVFGIGGGGCNAVNTMIKAGLSGVEYIVANTDAQALNASMASTKVQLGADVTKGLGAGANPEIGRKAALDEYEKLSEVLDGADMVFVTAGMGGGTGTGAAPVIAQLAKELGALTVGVVTKPFVFEGKKRFRQAEQGIQVLEENVDSLITIPNQRLLYLAGESLSLVDTFKKADEVLLNAVRGISDLINNTGHINADFADVKTVMANKGLALMGTGFCSGPDRAVKAATDAISSPLLEDITIDGATGIIINITGNESLTMHETNEAVTLIMEAADEDAEIIFGTVIDDAMEDDVKVTVVATGLGGRDRVTTQHVREQKVTRKDVEAQNMTVESEATSVPREEAPANTAEPTSDHQTGETSREWNESEGEKEWTNKDRHQPVEKTWTQEKEKNWKETVKADEDSTSALVRSIRDAANSYEKPHEAPHSGETEKTHKATNADRPTQSNSRAKAIAEKLGFINFDEDELDTPSYLRKDESDTSRSKSY